MEKFEFEYLKPIIVKGMKDVPLENWNKADYFQEAENIFKNLKEVEGKLTAAQLRTYFRIQFRRKLVKEYGRIMKQRFKRQDK